MYRKSFCYSNSQDTAEEYNKSSESKIKTEERTNIWTIFWQLAVSNTWSAFKQRLYSQLTFMYVCSFPALLLRQTSQNGNITIPLKTFYIYEGDSFPCLTISLTRRQQTARWWRTHWTVSVYVYVWPVLISSGRKLRRVIEKKEERIKYQDMHYLVKERKENGTRESSYEYWVSYLCKKKKPSKENSSSHLIPFFIKHPQITIASFKTQRKKERK